MITQAGNTGDPVVTVHGITAHDRNIDSSCANLANSRRRPRNIGAKDHDGGIAVACRTVLVPCDLRCNRSIVLLEGVDAHDLATELREVFEEPVADALVVLD